VEQARGGGGIVEQDGGGGAQMQRKRGRGMDGVGHRVHAQNGTVEDERHYSAAERLVGSFCHYSLSTADCTMYCHI
jgi:hypothetical protein